MFKGAIEWAVDHINENFQLSSDVRLCTYDLGETALRFVRSVWDVSMILASVVFAIVACYELHAFYLYLAIVPIMLAMFPVPGILPDSQELPEVILGCGVVGESSSVRAIGPWPMDMRIG